MVKKSETNPREMLKRLHKIRTDLEELKRLIDEEIEKIAEELNSSSD